MGDLEGIHEDVPFDWAGAKALAAKFRSVAKEVDGQVPSRGTLAREARKEWRGLYARKFDDRIKICTGDASALAKAMEKAAHQLDELARLAKEEQDRRLKARKWEEDQKNKSMFESFTDSVGITSYDDDKPPPVDHGEGRKYTAPAHLPGSRD